MEEPDASIARNKRRTPRRKSTLEVSLIGDVSMLDIKARKGAEKYPITLLGHTSDINETGLGLILPSFQIDEEYCVDDSRTLQLNVSLPSSPVRIEAAPVHCEPLDIREPENGYVLGMKIVRMDDKDRQRFLRFLYGPG